MPSLKAMAREAQKKPRAGAAGQAPNRKQIVFKSTERVADSDLESETESESDSDSEESSAIAPIPVAKLNGQKPKVIAASSEEQSENEDDKEDESESQRDAVVSNNHAGASDKSSDESESGSNGSSDSERESDEEEDHDTSRVAAQKTSSHIKEDIQAKSDKTRAIPIYNPPDGFTILRESNDGRRKVAEVFGRSNLAGKQLWYITAPASVPISAVKQVSLQNVQLGKPALSFGGCDYGFVQDHAGELGFTKVLIPDGNRTTYSIGQRAIDQTLHLQQIVQLHKTADIGPHDFSVRAAVAKIPVRKQPEGLKMRFRPIGFGKGKTGTIGLSSSSSDSPSSTDSDTDEEMEDAPPVSRQALDLDLANTRLSEHASKASESQDDTSSSGEEMDNPSLVAPAYSPSDSNSSSVTSSDEIEDEPKSTFAPEKSPSSPPRHLKRKLSDFKKDDKTSNTSHDQFKANGVRLKMSSTKNSGLVPQGSASNVNSHASTNEKKIPSTSSSKVTQVDPPRTSEVASGLIKSSKPKVTPILPPKQSSILPPGHGSKSPDIPRVIKTTGARPGTSPIYVDAQLSLEKKPQRSLEDRLQSVDSALSEKEREKGIRRLKKKDASRISKNRRRESINSATSDTLDRSINASSPSWNAHQHSFEARSPIKSSAHKDSSNDAKPSRMTSMEKVSKKPKKHPSTSGIHDEHGGTPRPRPSHSASTTIIPSGRKESVILPPKFARSISR